MTCNAEHPDRPGVRCRVGDDAPRHHYHQAPPDIIWPNTEVQQADQRRQIEPEAAARRRLLEMARATDAAAREARLPDPGGPHTWLRREPRQTEVQAAAASVVTNSRRRKQVLRVIAQHPEGITDDAVALILADPDLPAPRVASRRGDLERQFGWVEERVDESGRVMTALTSAGNQATLWVLTPAARAQIHEVDFSDV